MGLYAGDITAAAAWDLLSHNSEAVLVDVRTQPEWSAGVPDVKSINKSLNKIQIRTAPAYAYNENFLKEFENLNLDKNNKILFICRAGGRSAEAATLAAQLGYTQSYNVAGGEISWKESKLPWEKA